MNADDIGTAFAIVGARCRPRAVYVLGALLCLTREKPAGFTVRRDVTTQAGLSIPTVRKAIEELQAARVIVRRWEPRARRWVFSIDSTIRLAAPRVEANTLPLFD